MKHLTFITTAIMLLLFTSCGDKAKETRENIKDAKEGIGAFSKMAKEAQKAGKDIQKMAELEPLTSEDFKNWMPDKVGDLNRTGFKNNAMGAMNVASSEATYKNETGDKQIKVTVVDGAGTGSFAIAGIRMASQMDMEEQDENGYKKTVKYNGGKAMEEYETNRNRTELQFLHDERFGVTVDATGMDAKETWALVDELQLKKLSKMAK